jgi:hypothetical protein
MSDVVNTTAAQPLRYWQETRQPIYSALLVLPFLAVYEAGLLILRSDVINGGDAMLLRLGSSIMRLLKLHGSFYSVLVLAALFIAVQFWRKASWRLRPLMLLAAFFESLLYAVLLFIILGYFVQYLPTGKTAAGAPDFSPQRTQREIGPSGDRAIERINNLRSRSLHPMTRSPDDSIAFAHSVSPAVMAGLSAPAPMSRASARPGLRDFILYCGAGVYEELVFRVFLLGLLLLVFTKLFHMEHAYAAVWAVVLGAVIFSAFHHVGGDGFRSFSLGVFLQRVFAGLYFAAIYFNRSFGVAAASHSMYDILVGMNMYV